MQTVIVAFEREAISVNIREILESGGEFSCLVCRSAAEVKRAAHKQYQCIVVCGFKLTDGSCEDLFHDLPEGCFMLMVAPRASLELSETEGIFKLQSPIRRGELLASVRMLVQFQRYIPREKVPVRRAVSVSFAPLSMLCFCKKRWACSSVMPWRSMSTTLA